MNQYKKKHRSKESYKHCKAKEVLAEWLSDDYEVHIEMPFKNYGFRPDVTTSLNSQIQAFYEVVHKSDISGKTIGLMQYYCYVNNLELLLHVVDAEYILTQCDKPERIEKLTCELIK